LVQTAPSPTAGGRSCRSDGRTLSAGIVTIVFGVAPTATAVAVFYPRLHAIGAKPFSLARYTDADPLRMDQAVANELAYAFTSVNE
jgi:hypothetical protein